MAAGLVINWDCVCPGCGDPKDRTAKTCDACSGERARMYKEWKEVMKQ